jgi:hypothetical protein
MFGPKAEDVTGDEDIYVKRSFIVLLFSKY